MLLLFWKSTGTPPTPTPIAPSTGAGGGTGYRRGERRARGVSWEKRDEAGDLEAWLREAYAEIYEEKPEPAVAETVAAAVAPFKAEESPSIDWIALAQNIEAVRLIAAAYDQHIQALEAARIAEEEAAFMLLFQ
jgi:hypothetical protein